MVIQLVKEFLNDMNSHRLRTALTLIAITWGTMSVVLLLAFGQGFGTAMRRGMVNAWNRVLIVYGGETGKVYQGLPKGRGIGLEESDVELLKATVPNIIMSSPQYRKNVELFYGKTRLTTECEGAGPDFEVMRAMYPQAGGRFIDANDIKYQKRSLFLGNEIVDDLFKGEDPIGKTVLLDNVPFTVVGIMEKKLQTSMNNGPDSRRAIIPYSTFRMIYGYEHVNTILLKPASPNMETQMITEIRRVLGQKYRFDPTDERAVGIFDTMIIDEIIQKVSLGVTIFMGIVGFFTLMIAGVGVANVMYVVVKERTREIGIKMAVGARKAYILAQFVFEALFLSLIGGTSGLLLSWGIVYGVGFIKSDSGPMQFLGRPILSIGIMLFTVIVLTLIGLFAGVFPARRAAGVNPVESLRYE
ncbi:MAG TPA: ABC transporter permease [Candidatus Acidoferrales bacterium]|nr:ABC transporter permease [Candidatus Acidoferrales bacterium]